MKPVAHIVYCPRCACAHEPDKHKSGGGSTKQALASKGSDQRKGRSKDINEDSLVELMAQVAKGVDDRGRKITIKPTKVVPIPAKMTKAQLAGALVLADADRAAKREAKAAKKTAKAKVGFDRNAYQREYMRKKREAEKAKP